MNSYGERALTTKDIEAFGEQLSKAQNGDRITALENNHWHQIQEIYTKQDSGWHYTRTNLGTGQTYEDRNVSSEEVAGQVLTTAHSNDPMSWTYRRK